MIKKYLSSVFNRIKVESNLFKIYLIIKEKKFLIKSKKDNTYSQYGEDQFFKKYFKGRKGTYIDIGASHPFIISNTYLLYKNGWRGVTVEPIDYLHKRHKQLRPRDIAIKSLVGPIKGNMMFYQMIPSVLSTSDLKTMNELVKDGYKVRNKIPMMVETLSSIYTQYLYGQSVDLLSIDVEGADIDVLKSNDWSAMNPELIVCEVNDQNCNKVDIYLRQYSYLKIKSFGCNNIYKKNSID